MTKILCTGDTQLGVTTVELADQKTVLDNIVQVALDRKVDLVIHGGDVFEGPVVTPEHMRVFLDAINPLRSAGIPLLVIRGNGRHDLATRSVHALDFLHELDWVIVSDRPEGIDVDGLGVVTLPWVHPGNLFARIEKHVDRDQVNDFMAKILVQIAGEQRELLMQGLLPPGRGTILVAHWAISGSALPTGLSTDQMGGPVLSWADLDTLGFDCVVGAHIHRPQQLSQPLIDRTLGVVVGSPQPLSHAEGGYEHGCWLIEVAA